MTPTNRRGFTLIELLTVIVIIGVLVALTIPAVLMARSAMRTATCTNNQRELMVAVGNYETNKGNLPGYAEMLAGKRVGWPVELLAELGQNDVAASWAEGGTPVTQIPGLICPASFKDGAGALSYVANCGEWTGDVASGHEKNNGVFVDRTVKPQPVVYSDDIADGISSTIAFSENLNATKWYWEPDPPTIPTSNPEFIGAQGMVWAMTPGPCDGSGAPIVLPNKCLDEAVPVPDPLAVAYARPSSGHPGGVVVAYLDGGADFMSDDIDPLVYKQQMAPNDKEAGLL